MSTKVTVLNSYIEPKEIANTLRNHGVVVANLCTRPGAKELREEITIVLKCRESHDERLALYELEIWVDDDLPTWLNVFFFSPIYEFDYRNSQALVTRAMRAWDLDDQPAVFIYSE
ncbi:hypothetical protein [Pseudomonas syringae]|uniref:hypothetical protein n=1 Tax=Pseudomonas syringae TaxID=317 RepID=UPI0007EE2E9C|nr:hypothetical protein [Pseudomonas syringae]OBS34887.1 hypothetical protein A9K81_10280 [Pseudomonas syringae pv. syringae]OBS39822.1 hypothetical protein A9K79_09275 [Pseudomonas syringae pv. syringae]PBP70116.1 hypothetical protein CCL15_14855 [Pseudomonas syringae]